MVVTTFFPNAKEQHRTVFVKNLVRAMQAAATLTVVAPVPYAPPLLPVSRWRTLRQIPGHEVIDGIEVLHPRYLALPKLDWLSGVTYFFGVWRTLGRLVRRARPDLIHVHCGYPDSVGVALAARRLMLPFVTTLHGSDINVYATRATLKPQIRWALQASSGVVAVSEPLADKVRWLTAGTAQRLQVIPCAGFDPAVFTAHPRADVRRALGVVEGAKTVVFVGNLVALKGVAHLLDAWSRLRERGVLTDGARLIVIGDGVQRNALEQRTETLGIRQSVTFTGALPQAVVAQWIAASDMLCLPSHHEGTPNVVVEALAAGVPVVASRVGGIPALVRDGENGALIAPGEVEALADAIEQTWMRKWDRAAIRASVEHLTWAALATENLAMFAEVVKRRVL